MNEDWGVECVLLRVNMCVHTYVGALYAYNSTCKRVELERSGHLLYSAMGNPNTIRTRPHPQSAPGTPAASTPHTCTPAHRRIILPLLDLNLTTP